MTSGFQAHSTPLNNLASDPITIAPHLDGRRRVVVDGIQPQLDGGRTPVKRVVGDRVVVEADVLVDGHDRLAGVLLYRPKAASDWREIPLVPAHPAPATTDDAPVPVDDLWTASFVADALGGWEYTVSAWVDQWETWAWGLRRKFAARQDVSVELRMGAGMLAAAAARASAPEDRAALLRLAEIVGGAGEAAARVQAALQPETRRLMRAHADRSTATTYHPSFTVVVDPPRAVFSSWYELFPRSCSPTPGRHGTFRDAEQRLPYIAEMGFNVVYLPPIHPIGRAHRKGPDNSLTAGSADPGSPWAIGASEGGHLQIHPELGTLDDFRHFVAAARALDLEVALDIALQASPDHPYVKDHPEWFVHRPDGSIQYAENPPKKYQDIYPFDFAGPAWETLWREALGIFLYWIEQGVRVFRVDNPHTKPLPFWRWCIGSLKQLHPEVIFLAEAFTRPKLMYALAKAGFSQSYTYFAWRTSKEDLRTYVDTLAGTDVREFMRPNFWPNTPDILPEHLQFGTRATFIARAALAATLSPSWGIYGPAYELQEKVARAGSEEYAHNEKYELRRWETERPDSIAPVLRRLNQIRRDNRALQQLAGTVFHQTDNEALLCYSRAEVNADPASRNILLVVVNLDSHHAQSGWLTLDLQALGVAAGAAYQAHDLMSGSRYSWQGNRAFVSLDPQVMPVHVFRIRRHVHTEHSFEYYL